MLALFSFCSPPFYNMAAALPGFTSKFQAGRKRKKKESRKGYRVNRAGQLNLSLFLCGKTKTLLKTLPRDLLLTSHWPEPCPMQLLLGSDWGKRDFWIQITLATQSIVSHFYIWFISIFTKNPLCARLPISCSGDKDG